MSAPSISSRHALHLLLRVNKTLEQILAERANPPRVAEVPAKPAPRRRLITQKNADVCPKCGQEIVEGQLVSSDLKRHISCPEVAAYTSAA